MRGRLAALAATLVLTAGVFVQQPSWAQDAKGAVTVEEKQVFFVARRDTVFALIDLYSRRAQIEALSPAEQKAALKATAEQQGRLLLAKPGMEGVSKVRIEFGYIKNMDEYARQDFSSMVRHGHVLLQKDSDSMRFLEEKLDFKAGA